MKIVERITQLDQLVKEGKANLIAVDNAVISLLNPQKSAFRLEGLTLNVFRHPHYVGNGLRPGEKQNWTVFDQSLIKKHPELTEGILLLLRNAIQKELTADEAELKSLVNQEIEAEAV